MNKYSSDMKKQINDLLLKMQTGENCIGETANQLLDLFSVSGSLPLCKHEFEVKDQYWSSCKHCGMIIPNGNDR